MVALEAIRSSNNRIQNLSPGLVALFVGATNGIGESTARQFVRHAVRPKVYIVGRNTEAGNRILSELKRIRPEGDYRFIQKDLTLLKNVDEVCNEVKSKEKYLNLLCMSQGVLTMKGRDETSEGLDKKMMVHYYSRIRFIQQLLPELLAASPDLSRVVSVLAPGDEGTLDYNDLGLRQNFSLSRAADHCISMTDLVLGLLAKQNPTVSFVHRYPGLVDTGLLRDQNAFVRASGRLLMKAVSPWMMGVEECGERTLYTATSERYPPKNGASGGVSVGNEGVMEDGIGGTGAGAYLSGSTEDYRAKDKVLKKLREEGGEGKVWEHTIMEFDRPRA